MYANNSSCNRHGSIFQISNIEDNILSIAVQFIYTCLKIEVSFNSCTIYNLFNLFVVGQCYFSFHETKGLKGRLFEKVRQSTCTWVGQVDVHTYYISYIIIQLVIL